VVYVEEGNPTAIGRMVAGVQCESASPALQDRAPEEFAKPYAKNATITEVKSACEITPQVASSPRHVNGVREIVLIRNTPTENRLPF
jgi:hypothetical protein